MSNQNIKVVIAGSFGFMDIGDEAMLTEDLWFIRNSLGISNNQIYLVGENLEYISNYHDHPKENCLSSLQIQQNREALKAKKKWKQEIKRCVRQVAGRNVRSSFDQSLHNLVSSCNIALITGGGTINTRDEHGHSIQRIYSLIKYFQECGLRVFLSGQTIGPLGINGYHDHLAKEIVEGVDVLTVRDSLYSKRYLEMIKAKPKKFLETFDDAYTLPYLNQVLPEDCTNFLSRGDTIAVNVTDYTADATHQKKFIAKLCERLIKEDQKQILLVSHTPKDTQSLYVIFDMISNQFKNKVYLPDTRFWKDAVLKKLISCCQVAIGGRYHFIVFAGTSNTPFVGMSGNHYSYIKQDGFARALGLENFILTEAETWDENILWERYLAARDLKLSSEQKFSRPSASMKLFSDWLKQIS